MDLIVTGLSHKTAPVREREKLAFSDEENFRFLKELRQEKVVDEALLLSTCNRTELYACARHDDLDTARWLQNYLMRRKELAQPIIDSAFYSHSERYAVEHLFRVASGLESMALGENQILGQVRQAYHICCEARASGVILNKLLHLAFRTGKRARTKTAINAGAISISSAATKLAQKIFKDLSKHTALLIGAGDNGRVTAKTLLKRDVPRLLIANRTWEKAEELARDTGSEAIRWENLEKGLGEADVVISSTGARKTVVDAATVKRAMKKRGGRSLLIIDIAVPRDIEPGAGKLYNVFLHTIDDLQSIINRNMRKRLREVAKVEEIVKDEVENFLKWHRTLRITPLIKGLRRQFEKIRQGEIDKRAKKLDARSLEEIDQITRAIMNKILNTPMEKLREFNEDSQIGMARLESVREIFGLEDLEENGED